MPTQSCVQPRNRWRFSLLFLLVASSSKSFTFHAYAWFISAPKAADDWRQLSNLVVDTFEAPITQQSPWMAQSAWQIVERQLTRQYTYRHYVSTARKMKGKKYGLLVAKEWGKVIGMVEIGIQWDETHSMKRPTIGVLCVDERSRNRGVAQGLLLKSETIVTQVWKEPTIYAEVEKSNEGATGFFQSQGFALHQDNPVMVSLRRRRKIERRPHLLFAKSLSVPATSSPETVNPSILM
jgi:ribosomal protein S18 acetylase RimI-like enzyme